MGWRVRFFFPSNIYFFYSWDDLRGRGGRVVGRTILFLNAPEVIRIFASVDRIFRFNPNKRFC